MRRLRPVAVLVGAASVAVACTGGSGRPAGPAPRRTAGAVVAEAPTLRPLAPGGTPRWRVKGVRGAALRGDAAILGGADAHGADRLWVVDAATGKVRWSIREFGRLRGGGGAVWRGREYGSPDTPNVAGEGGDWGVLVTYFRTACRSPIGLCPLGDGPSDETGLAFLSGKDGSVRWRTPLVPSRTGPAARSANRLRGSLAVNDDGIALATVVSGTDARIGEMRLIAVDAATGRRLWVRSGVQPTLIGGGTVLGRVAAGAGRAIDLSGGSVVALDAATGRTRWDLSAGRPGSIAMLAAGGLAVVRRFAEGAVAGPPTLVDLASGREVARLPLNVTDCKTDGRSLIACGVIESSHYRLLTIRPGERTVRTAARDVPASTVAGVWQEHVFLDGYGDDPVREVDRSANLLADRLPGRPAAISDHYAIFVDAGSGSSRSAASGWPRR